MQYADIDATNWSTLKWIGTSPKHYLWHRDNRVDSPAMARGRAKAE